MNWKDSIDLIKKLVGGRIKEADVVLRIDEKALNFNKIWITVENEGKEYFIEFEGGLYIEELKSSNEDLKKSPKAILREIISKLEKQYEKGVPKEAILDEAKMVGISQAEVENSLLKLREMGEIYCPRPDHYRVVHEY
ncbi:hypothetical protein [Geoglobus acetivorans]|uniref:DNA replication helicase protein MCM n=1 Tax=Geoglobus acetivorans TaxID=565033 RepID=A0A0A7GG56_GEOAI|nr:DNA replication helicase protein MCM [Geoglobus acetivorans]